MSRRYRKKPVVIDAVQWDGSTEALTAIADMMPPDATLVEECNATKLVIPTLEGDMRANVGDFIIRGVKGEVYSCKPDVFEATYEPVDEDKQPPREHHPAVAAILRFFAYAHLPEHLQVISRPFAELAHQVAGQSGNAETTVALRKLLEAKDAAVRAVLP